MCVHMHVHGRVCQGGKEQRQEPFHTSAAKGEDLPQLHLYERLEAMEHFLGQEGSRILLRERGTWSGWPSELDWRHRLRF